LISFAVPRVHEQQECFRIRTVATTYTAAAFIDARVDDHDLVVRVARLGVRIGAGDPCTSSAGRATTDGPKQGVASSSDSSMAIAYCLPQ
jgi:hypothetical protein